MDLNKNRTPIREKYDLTIDSFVEHPDAPFHARSHAEICKAIEWYRTRYVQLNDIINEQRKRIESHG